MGELPDISIGEREASVLRMLRDRPIAPIPRGVCSSSGIAKLHSSGLIRRSSFLGFWEATDEGLSVEIDALIHRVFKRAPSLGWAYPYEPSPKDRAAMNEAWDAINGLRPGSEIFGGAVRQSTLEHLSGKSRAQRFVYFAYPIGFPMRHIAMVCNQDKPLWTELMANIERKKVGLPAMRYSSHWAKFREKRASDERTRLALLDEGCTPEEVREYFAAVAEGVVH